MPFLGSCVAFLLSPLTLLALALISLVVLLHGSNGRLQARAKNLAVVTTAITIAILVLPIGTWLLTPLENSVKLEIPQNVDGIIILSGDEKEAITEARGMPTTGPFSSERYLAAAALANARLHAKVIFVGANPHSGSNSAPETAVVAKETLTALRVLRPERWIAEPRSRTTRENALFTASLLQAQPEQNWVLVTSAWHMPRAILSFRAAGLNVYPMPVGWRTTGNFVFVPQGNALNNLIDFSIAVREYLGLIGYRLMGYTNALWP